MSMVRDDIEIRDQFDGKDRAHAALLYWQAFKGKLGFLLGPQERALRFLEEVIDPRFALAAYAGDQRLVGVAGFKTAEGQFVGGKFNDIQKVYGWFGAMWRGTLLDLLERPVATGELLMDGICVDETARGMGIGTRLLDAMKDKARAFKLERIRLDVIDTNPRARQLYERQGFAAGEVSHTGPFRRLFGFQSSTSMYLEMTSCLEAGGKA